MAALSFVVAGCGSSSAGAGPAPAPPVAHHAVGVLTETLVDTSRSTPAWGPNPTLPDRTLVTTVWYPAVGKRGGSPVTDAVPDRAGGPYPLIVFGHGLGSMPQFYGSLLATWAAAGFVVAAPRFPLSNLGTPGGPDGGDVGNQPADMSYVIGAVLQESAAPSGRDPGGILAGLVDPSEVGAAGHSNGAITTLGLVGDTCCRDPRVKAAVVMAGTTEGFFSGTYVLPEAPPMLVVHGTADPLIPYRDAVIVFDQARGPKALLTVHGGGHESAAAAEPASSTSVLRSTVDFFDAYLRHDGAAERRLPHDVRPGVTSLDYSPATGARTQLAVPALPAVHLEASVTPSTGLHDGETVTVRWSGYTAGKVVNLLECSHVDLATASSSGCDFSNARILHIDPTGRGSLTMKVATGAVGDGVCDASHSCFVIVNDDSATAPSFSREVPITFAP